MHWHFVYAGVGQSGKEEYLILNRKAGTYLTTAGKSKQCTATVQSPLAGQVRWNVVPVRDGTGRYWYAVTTHTREQ